MRRGCRREGGSSVLETKKGERQSLVSKVYWRGKERGMVIGGGDEHLVCKTRSSESMFLFNSSSMSSIVFNPSILGPSISMFTRKNSRRKQNNKGKFISLTVDEYNYAKQPDGPS